MKCLLPLLLLGVPIGLSAAEVSFNRDIRPILSDRCFSCHGPDSHERKAHLRLDIADGPDGAYRTHEGSTAIVPGKPDESEVWHRVISDDTDEVMPPPKSHKPVLTAKERSALRQWITAGAVYEGFWAFEPPVRPDFAQNRNAIDTLVRQRLDREGLSPAPPADKRTLVRRLYLDLIGLPPSPAEVRAFLADTKPDAIHRLVDDLLARPQFGENQARPWLDLVRFADTNGMHKDFYRNMYPYRDWVIRAFNDDLGYDDFLRYQLAGDLYADPTNDQLIASGFNRLHLIIDRGTALPEESYTKNVLDRVTAVGTAFLGLTVQCAQCHDHKYDPISQKDFYALFAFFNNLDGAPETAGRPRNGLQPPFVSLASEQQLAQQAALDQERETLTKEVNEMKAREKKHAAQKSTPETKEAHATQTKQLAAQRKKHEAALAEVKKKWDQLYREIPQAMVMKEKAEPRKSFLLERGQYDQLGEEVPRGTPAFLPPLNVSGDLPSRMDLAEWFLDPAHPLTARVAANRIWQQFFGVGLVKTAEDLGAQGEVPSHPELLDYLAIRYREVGWRTKSLIREIVLSQTYQQSSHAPTGAYTTDPENRLLARGSRFRLDAEVIRDQLLATSGLLSTTMYGPSVKPPQPPGLWASVTMTGQRFSPDQGDAIVRRSIYTFWKRAMPPPQMTLLNAPIRDACIARRERTNTPTQALLLLNEPEYFRAARHFAKTLLSRDGLDAATRIDLAWETITARTPADSERDALLKLIDDLQAHYTAHEALAQDCIADKTVTGKAAALHAAWTVAINSLYNLDETKTRE